MNKWKMTIDLRGTFHADDMSFIERRDVIVERMRKSRWYKGYNEYDYLPELIDELSETPNESDFDMVWDTIYDIANEDRVWIATR